MALTVESCEKPAPEEGVISTRLIVFSLALQLLDILITGFNVKRGIFSLGPGPVGRVFGLSPVAIWLVMKTSAFAIIVLAVMNGRRWLLLALGAFYLVYAGFGLYVLHY